MKDFILSQNRYSFSENLLKHPHNFLRCRKQRVLTKQQSSSQPAFTCSALTIKTPEQGVKYVQS